MTFRWFVTSSRDSRPREARAERQWFEEAFALLFGPERFQEDWKLSESEQRALTLLQNNLSPVQRAHFERYCHFEVIGGVSSKRYRIRYGRSMNVEELRSDGRIACRWCFSPRGALPVGDVMLAQKLALELFECEALLRANRVPRVAWPEGF